MVKVYIDGQEGTTGLKILERFKDRNDIELLKIDEDKRKDNDERKKMINSSDFTFLCLPDAAAKEAVAMAGDKVRIIDASTAHRTNPDWAYGFPELSKEFRNKIENSSRTAVPGCYASGFVSMAKRQSLFTRGKPVPLTSIHRGSTLSLSSTSTSPKCRKSAGFRMLRRLTRLSAIISAEWLYRFRFSQGFSPKNTLPTIYERHSRSFTRTLILLR